LSKDWHEKPRIDTDGFIKHPSHPCESVPISGSIHWLSGIGRSGIFVAKSNEPFAVEKRFRQTGVFEASFFDFICASNGLLLTHSVSELFA
jgi:hypothetical protein